jgi:hypothetical protein
MQRDSGSSFARISTLVRGPALPKTLDSKLGRIVLGVFTPILAKESSNETCPWRIDIVASFERNVTMLHCENRLNGIFGRHWLMIRRVSQSEKA